MMAFCSASPLWRAAEFGMNLEMSILIYILFSTTRLTALVITSISGCPLIPDNDEEWEHHVTQLPIVDRFPASNTVKLKAQAGMQGPPRSIQLGPLSHCRGKCSPERSHT